VNQQNLRHRLLSTSHVLLPSVEPQSKIVPSHPLPGWEQLQQRQSCLAQRSLHQADLQDPTLQSRLTELQAPVPELIDVEEGVTHKDLCRSARPPVFMESLNGLEEAPPTCVTELSQRLASGVDAAFIPQHLQACQICWSGHVVITSV
jgi:hypothetical protein